jgi:hypothetical protein
MAAEVIGSCRSATTGAREVSPMNTGRLHPAGLYGPGGGFRPRRFLRSIQQLLVARATCRGASSEPRGVVRPALRARRQYELNEANGNGVGGFPLHDRRDLLSPQRPVTPDLLGACPSSARCRCAVRGVPVHHTRANRRVSANAGVAASSRSSGRSAAHRGGAGRGRRRAGGEADDIAVGAERMPQRT